MVEAEDSMAVRRIGGMGGGHFGGFAHGGGFGGFHGGGFGHGFAGRGFAGRGWGYGGYGGYGPAYAGLGLLGLGLGLDTGLNAYDDGYCSAYDPYGQCYVYGW